MGLIISETIYEFAHLSKIILIAAKDQKDMRSIYDTIDQLEKTEYETDIFSRYHDLFMSFLWVLLVLVLLEIFLSSVIWFGL